MIPFNIPPCVGGELEYIGQAVASRKICGDGEFTARASKLLESATTARRALLATSCTHALEMAAILCDIKPGDEVIMSSYTFVSTANAFVLRGATVVFVDIRPDTMNLDEALIEAAITTKTRAIVPVHYAGVACEMDVINALAEKYGLFVVEDAAQGIGATYHGKPLGSLGTFGCLSFHETKNASCGEGGALLINDAQFAERAEIIREKGTNRSKFFRGEIDKYSWCDIGSSYLPSELNAAYLTAQLEKLDAITADRLETWQFYSKNLAGLPAIETAAVPDACGHNGHMFWLKVRDLEERGRFLAYLKERGVHAVFHYIPLHSSAAGMKLGRFHGEDRFTTPESERLVRLPLYYGLTQADRESVVEVVRSFWGGAGCVGLRRS